MVTATAAAVMTVVVTVVPLSVVVSRTDLPSVMAVSRTVMADPS